MSGRMEQSMSHRKLSNLLRNGIKILLIVLAAAWIVRLPEAEPDTLLHYRNAIVVLSAVVMAGKILYDTLFFDRYC